MWEVTQVSKADAKENYPFALVLMPFSLLLQPRTAWHENCEAEILACLSPNLGKRSACLLQAGVRLTRHETRITVFSRFAMGAQEWRHQNPPPGLPRRPVTAFLCAMGRLWSGMSGKSVPCSDPDRAAPVRQDNHGPARRENRSRFMAFPRRNRVRRSSNGLTATARASRGACGGSGRCRRRGWCVRR